MSPKIEDCSDIERQAVIISADDHDISPAVMDQDAVAVMTRLMAAGYTAYLVGGGVRDLYQGKKPKDFDISTDARPGQLRKLFKNSRTIGRRFRLVQVFFPGNKIMEVSTFRCRSEFDLKGKDEVLAANNTYGDHADDAVRRDLTINGLFFEIENNTIIDFVGGVQDLKDKIVRVIGDPEVRITRDPVRMLRAVRHAARAGFTIEEKTWNSIITHADSLSVCPVSRIRDELFKDLRGGSATPWLKLVAESGLLSALMPIYKDLLATDDGDNIIADLQKVFAVVDRLFNQQRTLVDDFLFAFLLLPWAQKTFPEMSMPLKTGESFALSREISSKLKTVLAHLDVKRATKEQVATLLALLPLFASNIGSWPKWLQKKSYFKDGLLFFSICVEAGGGEQVAEDLIPKVIKKYVPIRNYNNKQRRGRGPAYAAEIQVGGVFGFKK